MNAVLGRSPQTYAVQSKHPMIKPHFRVHTPSASDLTRCEMVLNDYNRAPEHHYKSMSFVSYDRGHRVYVVFSTRKFYYPVR